MSIRQTTRKNGHEFTDPKITGIKPLPNLDDYTRAEEIGFKATTYAAKH
jgi:hypothetical protein